MYWLISAAAGVIVLFVLFISVITRYKKCPSDKILIVYGKVAKGSTSKCVHGGAAFVWPIIQDFAYLSLTPMQIEVPLQNALSKQNIRVDVPSNFTVGISTKPEIMTAAAERLLGLQPAEIQGIAKEIIFGQLRLSVAMMDIEEINADRDKFLENIYKNVEVELEKIGLRLINVNITDIQDESGYIKSLGQKAAAEALNKAKKDVAEKDRDGAIGQANADKDKRVNVASANATAVEGENTAQVTVANSTSDMRQKKAEAERAAIAAEKVANAKALQEAYAAEQIAEAARADRERATQTANEVVKAEIDRKKIEIAAGAQAEKLRLEARGQADATYANLEAQARGLKEMLVRQAEGLKEIVAATGSSPLQAQQAAMLMIVDKLPEIIRIQVEAIKGIKIDKVTVWDGMGNGAGNGKPTTANFLSGMLGSVPPLQDLFNMAGMKLPEYLGQVAEKLAIVEKPEVKKS
jgi:flotillin